MTKAEARKHPDYLDAMNKIKNYTTSFRFTVPYAQADRVSPAKGRALRMLMHDAEKAGLVKSVCLQISLDGTCCTSETFVRTEVQA